MLLDLGAEVHQPVGEVGPHNRPPVASPVGVVLLDVVLILISRVQDNNLNDKEKEPAPHVAVASLELIEVTMLRKYFI